MAQVGDTLICSQGLWDDVVDTYTYRPHRDGAPIQAASASNEYVLTNADEGHMISFEIIATNDAGSASSFAAAVGPIEAGTGGGAPVATPVNSTPASIDGVPTRGQTLTATPGDWDNAESVSGHWESAGAVLSGETGLTLAVTSAIDLTAIQYIETATGGGVTVEQASNTLQWAPEMTFTEVWHVDDLVPLLADDAFVDTWVGRNGLHTLTASGTSRPVLHHASGGEPAYLYFDGIDDNMRADSAAAFLTVDESFSVLTSFEQVRSGSVKYLWCGDSGASSSWKGPYLRNDDYDIYLRSSSATYVNGGPPDSAVEPDWMLVTNEEGEPPSRPYDVNMYTSDSGATPAYSKTGTVGGSGATFTRFALGCQLRGTILAFYKGKVRAHCMLDRVLTDDEIGQVVDWIDGDWA